MVTKGKSNVELIKEEVFGVELKNVWDRLYGERTHLHDRWIDYAGWTIPSIYSNESDDSTTEMQHDYQALGAQLVNHLSNKLSRVLFQPGRPFFKLDLDTDQLGELLAAGKTEAVVDELLAHAEKQGMKELAKAKLRSAILSVMKALIVTGNSLLYFPDTKNNVLTAQVYSVHDYVVSRDMSGVLVKLITRDRHKVATLPEDLRQIVVNSDKAKDYEEEVTIFTAVRRTTGGRYVVWQEIEDLEKTPRELGVYAEKDLPWLPLTWNLDRGKDYGTGLVEEYAGDFYTYSSLSEAIINLASIASDIKILVNPMGATNVEDLNQAESGTYVYGSADDITYLQLEKLQDAKFIIEQAEVYARRLGAGFLFNAAVTRDAERVTAEEIRMQANELEGSMGGIYSRLAEDMQQPIARLVMRSLGDAFKNVEPVIITGVESLSRTTELEQIMLFLMDLAQTANLPPEVLKRLDFQGLISKLGAARHVEYRQFLLSEDTVKANDQAQAQLEAKTAADSRPQQQTQQVV